jgi:hypothetical protein
VWDKDKQINERVSRERKCCVGGSRMFKIKNKMA